MEEETKTTNLKEEAKDLTEHVANFLETYLKLMGIRLAQKTITFVSSLVNFAILALLFFLVVFFLGFGLAWWLGTVVNSRAGGFFIVAGIYLTAMVFLMAMGKKTIIPFLRNLLTRLFYE
ncbi:MAG: phage holin family protein [Chitinophagales bacterium]